VPECDWGGGGGVLKIMKNTHGGIKDPHENVLVKNFWKKWWIESQKGGHGRSQREFRVQPTHRVRKKKGKGEGHGLVQKKIRPNGN